jgi:TonB family protein
MGAESETERAGPRRPRKSLLLALGAGVLALAGSFAFLERNRLFPAPKVDVFRTGSGTPLKLILESQGNGLNIRWNPENEPVVNAREGKLVIKEGDQKVQTLLFDPQQLKTGYVYYESTAERLEFQMEVVDAAGVIAEASVTALPSRTAVAQVVEPPPATGLERNASAHPSTAPHSPEPPQSTRPAARPFLPPPSGQHSAERSRVIALEPPTNLPNNLTSPGVSLPPATSSLAGLRVQGPPPSQPIQSRPIPASQSVPNQPIKIGGNLQAGKLVKMITPVYPALAKSARIQGTVRFTALIAKNGTVQNLQLISGHPILIQAATEAVKQWVYRPTLLNGEPTEVITQIDVNFTL